MEGGHLSKQSCFNSRIGMKFDWNWPIGFRRQIIDNIMILYMFSAQGQEKITLTE